MYNTNDMHSHTYVNYDRFLFFEPTSDVWCPGGAGGNVFVPTTPQVQSIWVSQLCEPGQFFAVNLTDLCREPGMSILE